MSRQPGLISDDTAALVAGARWITVFSGAGMSAESGVATFRDAQTGLWARYDPEALSTPQAWESDPALVWGWYQWRAHLVRVAEPNAGHRALADLSTAGMRSDDGQEAGGGEARAVMVVTQNVDDLHERAGTPVVSHLHGSLFAPRCSACEHPYPRTEPSIPGPETFRIAVPRCQVCDALVRPGIVWFGEALPADAWNRAESAFRASDLILVVGTSGLVYPAASLPERAARADIPIIEINPESSLLTPIATHRIRAGAARALPALVEAITR